MTEATNRPGKSAEGPRPAEVKVIEARKLFEGGREVYIEHDGVRYRLRLTRRNRLILQK